MEPVLSAQSQHALLALARGSLAEGLPAGRAPSVRAEDHAPELREPGASFVTLLRRGHLRGCIGSLEAHRPLCVDVAHNAFAAATRDYRLPSVTPDELAELTLSISVLGSAQPVPATTREEAARQLQPGVDGVILECGALRATFLPQVWANFRDGHELLDALRDKAGLDRADWPTDARLWRYRTACFAEPDIDR